MKQLLLGIDIGTSSVKATVIDGDGRIVVQASQEHSLQSPNPGWAEESPQIWWENTHHAISSCLGHPDVSANAIAGIGVTGMIPAVVLIDQEGNTLRPSIQQNDSRTSKEIDEFNQKIGPERFFELTGASLSQQSVGPKLVWLQRNEPRVWSKTRKVMGSFDYINRCLTGQESLEANWALESGLFDVSAGDWSDELLEVFNVERGLFPTVRRPDEIIGKVSNSAAISTGLRAGTPVVAGTADHVGAAIATGLSNDGDLLIKFGSAGDILFSTDQLVMDRRLFIDYHDIPGKFLLNGCMATSGSLLKWFVEQFCEVERHAAAETGQDVFDLMNAEASQISPGCDGLVVLPYFLGEKTPIFDPNARGIFYGMSLFHTRYHLYRAIMEAVVFGFKHHVKVLQERGLHIKRVLISEGGAKSKLWRQIAADVLETPVIYLRENPGASLAAAFVAGIGVGVFESWEDINRFNEIESIEQPDLQNSIIYAEKFELYLDLYKNLYPIFQNYSG